MGWDDPLAGIDVEGPVLVEVFVLCVRAPRRRRLRSTSARSWSTPCVTLAWLARDDEVVQAKLSEEWLGALAPYLPEPFRNLG